MSFFNDDQLEHMEYLSSKNPEDLCWCGWYLKGECANCPPDKSAKDKLRAMCSDCGNAPSLPGSRLIHTVWCPRRVKRGVS